MFTDANGAACDAPAAKLKAGHRPLTAQLMRRNDALLCLADAGFSAGEVGKLAGISSETLRSGLREARDRRDADGTRLQSSEIGRLRAEVLLDTPMTDDPGGPKYRDHPEAAAWIHEHADEL